MSIIIKNMDKPSDCCYCPLYSYGYCKALGACVNTEHGIDTRCPLIKIEQYEPKCGEWIDFKNGWKCSACRKWNNETTNFWPNCGADMREGEDEPQTDAYDSAKFSHNCIGICENPRTYMAKIKDELEKEDEE